MRHYTTLEQLRADKAVARRKVSKGVKRLKADIAVSLAPQNSLFASSGSRTLNIIGYGIAAYKAAMSMRNLYKFIAKIL